MSGERSREDDCDATVLARDSDETFELTPEDEAKLLESIREADLGDTVSAAHLVRDLRAR